MTIEKFEELMKELDGSVEDIDGAEIAWNAFEPNHTVVDHKDIALGTY